MAPADRPLRALLQTAGDAPLWLGVEHEYIVRSAGRPVDFTTVIHGLGLGQRHLDPVDPHAYRMPSGAAWTCDGREAEIALAPTEVAPGFSDRASAAAGAERAAMARRLGHDLALEGCSTHLSVSVARGLERAVADLYARRFAPAMMMLLDRRDSPGLLVRPRPGRVEIGGEYAVGGQLAAAALFAVGSVLACLAAVRGRTDEAPPAVVARVDPAVERHGWYVDRRAFGTDLYRSGRRTVLKLTDGGEISAQDQLVACWRLARVALAGIAAAPELRLADGVVAGRLPIPLERPERSGAESERDEEDPAYGSALRARRRGSFDVAPVMLTWELAVFLVVEPGTARRAFAAVAGPELESFLSSLDRGALDGAIVDHLRRRRRRVRLESWAQLDRIDLVDEIGPRIRLLRPEFGQDGQPMAAATEPLARRRTLWRALLPAGARSA